MPGRVLPSASTCLLIALPLLCYIDDGTKLQFGQEGAMPAESTMRYERSRPLKPNREDVDLTACRPVPAIAVSIDPIGLGAESDRED
jgi:hypothetical protein